MASKEEAGEAKLLIMENTRTEVSRLEALGRLIDPELKRLIDETLVPILVERYLAEHGLPVQWQSPMTIWGIYKREESGELIEVTASEDRAEAEAVAERMRQLFSAEYVVKESEPSEQPDDAAS